MPNFVLWRLTVAAAVLAMSSCLPPKTLQEVKNNCIKKGAYFYQEKCWPDFTESTITAATIDSVVQEQMSKAAEAFVKINDKRFTVDFFLPEGKEVMLSFNQLEENLLLLFAADPMKKKRFSAEVMYVRGKITEEENGTGMPARLVAYGEVDVSITEDFDVKFSGTLENRDNTKQYQVEAEANEAVMGMGTSRFEISGEEAFLSGILGTATYHQLKRIIENNPEVKTIVLNRVEGSINDEVNMHTGRILREAGLNTKVLSDSDIASGGVDLFAAGVERIVEKGARLGVHSWGGGPTEEHSRGDKLPKNHPAHQYQLRYFSQMLGTELGPDFYFYTLQAAPVDGMHYMSDQEIKDWKLATSFR